MDDEDELDRLLDGFGLPYVPPERPDDGLLPRIGDEDWRDWND